MPTEEIITESQSKANQKKDFRSFLDGEREDVIKKPLKLAIADKHTTLRIQFMFGWNGKKAVNSRALKSKHISQTAAV